MVYAGSYAGTLGSPHRAIGIIEFDGCSARGSQRFTKDGRKKHVCTSGMNMVYLHAHLLHDFHAIAEREHNTFLGCSQQMCLGMVVEIQSVYAATCIAVFQHPLGTIAKRNNGYALGASGYLSCQVVHLGISQFRGDVAMHPRI